jgi:hypothetical protein
LYAHPSDAMGAAPATTATAVLSAQSAAIASAMTAESDPQQRQQLFSRVLSDIGLAQLHRCDRLTLTRLTDTTGTTALLLESPEPVSFLHDATLALRHRIWLRPPPWNQADGLDPNVIKALTLIQAGAGGLVAPAAAASVLLAAHCQVALITSAAPDFSMDLYDVPPPGLAGRPVVLAKVATLDARAADHAGLTPLTGEPAGLLAAIRPDRSIAGIALGPWAQSGGSPIHLDVPVTVTLLGNGDETATLILPSMPLQAGTYLLDLGFNRVRWVTTVPDPEAVYQDSASVQLTW